MSRTARRRSLGAVALIAWLAAGGAEAGETRARAGPVSVRVALSPEAPVIGDPLVLDVEAVAEPGVELLMPDFGEALDRFRIVDFVPREKLDDAGRTVATQRYTLEVPASGEHRVPAILVEFVDRRPGRPAAPEDADAFEVMTDPIAFTVESVVPDSARADLDPPLGRLDPSPTGGGPPWLALAIAAVVLLAAAPFLGRALAGARRRAGERSAWEVARGELDALLAAPSPTPEEIDAYFVHLSGIVRRYLEARFGVRSPELTTERFLEVASGSPDLTDDHRALLRDFLLQCDFVKFAHAVPSPEAVRQALDAAERFVEETRTPAAEGVAEAGAGAAEAAA